MKVFTIYGSSSVPGTEVTFVTSKSGEVIPGVMVGSSEKGCDTGFIRIEGQFSSTILQYASVEHRMITSVLHPKKSHDNHKSEALVVLRTPVNQGGKNFHTGDKSQALCYRCEIEFDPREEVCSYCKRQLKSRFHAFPGKILATGTVRNGKVRVFGNQHIAVIKRGDIFRTAYNGYTPSMEGAHYHFFDGNGIITIPKKERYLTKLL